MNKDKYKLVGVLNDIDVVPGFIYPIFIDKNNNLYRGYVDIKEYDNYNCCFTKFTKLPDEYVSKVKYLSDCIIKFEDDHEEYQIGDLPICGIEINKNVVYIGRIDKYLDFIDLYKEEIAFSNYSEYNELLLTEIEDEIEFTGNLVKIAKEQGLLEKTK